MSCLAATQAHLSRCVSTPRPPSCFSLPCAPLEHTIETQRSSRVVVTCGDWESECVCAVLKSAHLFVHRRVATAGAWECNCVRGALSVSTLNPTTGHTGPLPTLSRLRTGSGPARAPTGSGSGSAGSGAPAPARAPAPGGFGSAVSWLRARVRRRCPMASPTSAGTVPSAD